MKTQTKNVKRAKNEFKPHTTPKLAIDNTIHEHEHNIAVAISQSKKPVIIITQARAKKYASYEMMRQALPNVPIIFENIETQNNFMKGRFCDLDLIQKSCLGHFENINDYRSIPNNDLCSEIKQSDCVIVLGTPKESLQIELDKRGDYFINHTNASAISPRINFSTIASITRNKDEWKNWNNSLQHRPSL